MILPGSYANGFAPRDGQPLYPELWRGCVGAWAPCLGPTGLTLRDWSGFGSNGVFNNMTAAAWRVDKSPTLLFNGSNNNINLTGSVLNFGGDFSVSVWIKTSTTASGSDWFTGAWVVTKDQPLQGNAGWFVAINAGKINAGVWDQRIIGSRSVNDNVWHHVVFTRQSTGPTAVYVDGVLDVTGGTESRSAFNTQPINLGAGVNYFPGYMNDIRVYTRVLSPNECKLLSSRFGIAYELAPRRRSRVSVLTSLRYNIFTGNVGSLEVIGAS